MQRQRTILFVNLFFIYLPCNLIIFILKDDLKSKHYEALTAMVIIRGIALSIFELYLFSAFIKHFSFFVIKKAEWQYETTGSYLTPLNKFIIIWCLFLWIMKLLYGIGSIFLVTYERLGDKV